MGIEEQIDKLIDLGEDIKSRLDRLIEAATDHFVDASKMVSDEPPKKWRILEPGELIKQGDWSCPKSLPSCNDPVKGNGWIVTGAWGLLVREDDVCVYARPVFDDPAKEPGPPNPPEPEYREPVLPADAGEQCEFSRDGKEWCKFLLAGWQVDNNPWICERYHCWPYARIKKDA